MPSSRVQQEAKSMCGERPLQHAVGKRTGPSETPEELDRELPTQVREFVAGHVALGTNLAEIQRECEEAEKAAREELKKKQKTVGNGGAKGKAAEPAPKQEDKPVPAPPPSPMLSLFDLSAQDEAAPCPTSGQETKENVGCQSSCLPAG